MVAVREKQRTSERVVIYCSRVWWHGTFLPTWHVSTSSYGYVLLGHGPREGAPLPDVIGMPTSKPRGSVYIRTCVIGAHYMIIDCKYSSDMSWFHPISSNFTLHVSGISKIHITWCKEHVIPSNLQLHDVSHIVQISKVSYKISWGGRQVRFLLPLTPREET